MHDFTFLNPYWCFALIPAVLLVATNKNRERTSALFAPHIAKHFHITTAQADRVTPYLTSLIWGLMIFALAGPSLHQVTLPTYHQGGARVLAIQLSDSMYAQDITPSRLSQARFKALDLLPLWREGQTGLVAYAGDAYSISPMTKDSTTLVNQIKQLSPALMPYPGNNTLRAVEESIKLLKAAGHQQGDIVLLTDGVSALNKKQILKTLEGEKWHISVLAIATKAGAPIVDAQGSMIKDIQGHSQISQLDAKPLQELASKTGGVYVQLSGSQQDINYIAQVTTDNMSQSKKSGKQIQTRSNDGYWLLFPIVLLFLFLSRRSWLMLVCLALSAPHYSYANPLLNTNTNAYQLFEKQEYKRAAQAFNDPQWKGIAQYRAGDYKGAVDSFSQSSDIESLYNLGNAYAKLGEYNKAIQAYKQVLKQNAQHSDAKKNLELLEQKQQKDQKQQQQEQQQQNSEQQNSDNSNKKQKDSEKESSNKVQEQSAQEQSAQENNSQHQQEQDASQTQNAQQSLDNQSASQSQQEKEQQAKNEMQQAMSNAESEQKQEQESSQDQGAMQDSQSQSQVEESDPVMRKLDQIPDDPSRLIRAQILLQAQERQREK